jgi:hypothetical protein
MMWENRAVFEAWTKSEAFRAAHGRAGGNEPLYLDHPQFEGFEVRQTVGARQGGAACLVYHITGEVDCRHLRLDGG